MNRMRMLRQKESKAKEKQLTMKKKKNEKRMKNGKRMERKKERMKELMKMRMALMMMQMLRRVAFFVEKKYNLQIQEPDKGRHKKEDEIRKFYAKIEFPNIPVLK